MALLQGNWITLEKPLRRASWLALRALATFGGRVQFPCAARQFVPVSQSAEEIGLKPIQCGFKSHQGHAEGICGKQKQVGEPQIPDRSSPYSSVGRAASF